MAARQTSIVVYRQIEEEGLLSRMRWLVYSWLYKNGPATALEAERGMPYRHANKRLSELQQQGVVTEIGTKECSVSGRESLSWDVTANLPIGFAPQKKKRQNLELELAEARAEIKKLKRLLRKALSKMEENGVF